MAGGFEPHDALTPWVTVARTVWTPTLREHAGRAHNHMVPTTGQEYALIDRFFADPATLRESDSAEEAWSNVGEALGWLVLTEVTADRPAVPADLYYCCGVVMMHLVACAGPPYLVDEEHAIHALVGAAYNVVQRRDQAGRVALCAALGAWPDAFGREFAALRRGPDRRNRMPAMLAALVDDTKRLGRESLHRRAAKFRWMLGRQFCMPQDRAQALVAALARRVAVSGDG